MRTTLPSVEFHDDPTEFLAVAGEHLAADPVVGTVVTTVAHRDAEGGVPRSGDRPFWYAVVRDDLGQVAGAAMRTAPFPPHPLFVLPMPDEAARRLAGVLHDRGEHPGGVNGALPAARVLAEAWVRLAGGHVEVQMHTRLFELGDLVVPPSPAGGPRVATRAEEDLVLAWFGDFHRAADEQAGRQGGHGPEAFALDDIRRRIDEGRVLLWVDGDGDVVHLTGFNAPAFGVARIGPVYTPPEHRGRGYASATVAEASRRLRADGARICLFTDQANPTSNHVYEALGFRPVVDMANLLLTG